MGIPRCDHEPEGSEPRRCRFAMRSWRHRSLWWAACRPERHTRDSRRSGPPSRSIPRVPAISPFSQVLSLADGGFIVTWEGSTDTPFAGQVYGQRFDNHGTPIDNEFALTGITADRLSASTGNSVVATSTGASGPSLSKFGADGSLQISNVDPGILLFSRRHCGNNRRRRRCDLDRHGYWVCSPETVRARPDTHRFELAGSCTRRDQQRPSFDGYRGRSGWAVPGSMVCKFSSALWGRVVDVGAPHGDRFPLVDPGTLFDEVLPPQVCADQESANFVVAWQEYDYPAEFRRFDSDGVPLTPHLCAGFNNLSSVACSTRDRVIISGSDYVYTDTTFVAARAIDRNNAIIGNLLIPISLPQTSSRNSAGTLADGSVVFVWGVCPQFDSLECDVYAQLFQLTDEPECLGDCDGDGVVDISELMTAVDFALNGSDPVRNRGLNFARCGLIDANLDCQVSISELVGAVDNALSGCP